MASDGDEVAEDYRHALEDLSSNGRFEISNLTLIARENTEHALAIAEVLQQHILKVGFNIHSIKCHLRSKEEDFSFNVSSLSGLTDTMT